MRDALVNSRVFVIVERASIDKVLEEQSLQQSGCVDASCAVKLGRLVAAEKILTGRVFRRGKDDYMVSVQIVDVERGTTDLSEKGEVNARNLEWGINRFTRNLTLRIAGKDPFPEPNIFQKRGPVLWRSALLPGWGQWQEGSHTAGATWFGLFAAAAALHVVNLDRLRSARSAYESTLGLPGLALEQDMLVLNTVLFERSRRDYRAAGERADLSYQLVFAIWTAAFLDAFVKPGGYETFFVLLSEPPSAGGHLISAGLHVGYTIRF